MKSTKQDDEIGKIRDNKVKEKDKKFIEYDQVRRKVDHTTGWDEIPILSTQIFAERVHE